MKFGFKKLQATQINIYIKMEIRILDTSLSLTHTNTKISEKPPNDFKYFPAFIHVTCHGLKSFSFDPCYVSSRR